MNTKIEPISDLAQLGEHMNQATLAQRVVALEKQVRRLEALAGYVKPKLKPKKELTQVGNFAPYILNLVGNGKIWSCYALAEEIRSSHPDLPHFTVLAIQNSCGRMHKKGQLTKIAQAVYRKA